MVTWLVGDWPSGAMDNWSDHSHHTGNYHIRQTAPRSATLPETPLTAVRRLPAHYLLLYKPHSIAVVYVYMTVADTLPWSAVYNINPRLTGGAFMVLFHVLCCISLVVCIARARLVRTKKPRVFQFPDLRMIPGSYEAVA